MSKEKVSFGERAKKAIGIEGDTKKVVFPMIILNSIQVT